MKTRTNKTTDAARTAGRVAFTVLALWSRGLSWVVPVANVILGAIF